MMRRTAWLIAIVILLFASVLYPVAWMLLPTAALLFTPLVSWLLLLRQKKYMYLEMESPAVCAKNSTFQVRIVMRSRFRRQPGPAEVTLRAENAVTGEYTRLRLYPAPEAEAELYSRYCGCLRIKAESARLYDVFGVLPLKLDCTAEKRTLVMPDTVDVQAEPFMALSPQSDSMEYAQDRKGQDRSETFQVREYVPGDSLSQIHWKLSGKQEKLIIRDGSYPVDQSLLVYLDRYAGDLDPAGADALLESVISVCQALSEAKMPFCVGWNDDVPHAENVSEPEQFTGAVALLMNLERGARGGFTQYLETYGPPEGGRLLYFSSELPVEWSLLAERTSARAFLCTGESFDSPDVIGFTPETIEGALQEVSW